MGSGSTRRVDQIGKRPATKPMWASAVSLPDWANGIQTSGMSNTSNGAWQGLSDIEAALAG